MKGSKIIKLFNDTVIKQDPSLMDKVQVMAAKAQMEIYDIHSRAIACHCECMGMDIENGFAISEGRKKPPFGQQEFNSILIKWGLINEGNNPII